MRVYFLHLAVVKTLPSWTFSSHSPFTKTINSMIIACGSWTWELILSLVLLLVCKDLWGGQEEPVFFPILWCCKEVPIWVGSPDGGSHKGGSPRHPQPMANTQVWEPPHTQRSRLFSFLNYFLLVFLNFPDLSPSSLCFWIFLIRPIKNCSMRTWEHRNIAWSPPLRDSQVIFCWGRNLKIQREIKREVFM